MSDETKRPFSWQSAISETFDAFREYFLGHVPQLMGAILLLIIGFGLAVLARIATRKIVRGVDALLDRFGKPHLVQDERFRRTYRRVISEVVFWFVILFFAAASANLLEWDLFSGWMGGLVGFLPKVLTGLLIILAGFFIGNVVQSLIINTNLKVGPTQAAILARTAQIAILLTAVVVGVEHIGLDMNFLTGIVLIVLGVLLAGACLAFGLGARDLVANTIGAQSTRKNCRVGETIKLAGFEGEILEIRQTCIVLDTLEGRAIIPARRFHEEVCFLRSAKESTVAEPDLQQDDRAARE